MRLNYFLAGILSMLPMADGQCLLFTKALFQPVASPNNADKKAAQAACPVSAETKAGTWKTYLLTAPTAVTVAAPMPVTSANYRAELTSLTRQSAHPTPEQREAVAYWHVGAVYRWGEIARELATQYNNSPARNAQGNYPVPDPKNPLNNPRFPFANPPYIARMLAYLSVAQYDALVSAWHYKYRFGRPAPPKTDSTTGASRPVSPLPSYPSEDAVVAAASHAVLTVMFPGEAPFLDAKLAEHRNSRLWAGLNVLSDLDAGADLGGQVAAKVLARSRTDGMNAANRQALTAGMIEAATRRGLTEVWVSKEQPARPPMLPNFGAVLPWNFDRSTVAKLRPGPPPAVGSPAFRKALDELIYTDKQQTREQADIANYWSFGSGTYSPVGHWHRVTADAAHEAGFGEIRMARTLALVSTALMDAGICCWDTKFYYYYPRPQQFGVNVSVGLPNFPSYSSGHSTFSAAAATVLADLFPDRAGAFWTQAKQASDSRIYGLIHYRFDCEVGLACGKNIGDYAVKRGRADRSGLSRRSN